MIIATQMLDSMQHSRHPTRAEVTDVANAILDGCDACMLSGETAIGEFPVQAVEMMNRIAMATEPLLRDRAPHEANHVQVEDLHRVTQAVVYGVQFIAAAARRPVGRGRHAQRRHGVGLVEAAQPRADGRRLRVRGRLASKCACTGASLR